MKETKKTEKLSDCELTIPITIEEQKVLERIASSQGDTIQSLLKNYIEHRAYTYEENSIACDDCGKKIKEGDEYFVQESSISTYEKQNGRIEENKLEAWSDFCICMDCKTKRIKQDITTKDPFVRDFKRNCESYQSITKDENKDEPLKEKGETK